MTDATRNTVRHLSFAEDDIDAFHQEMIAKGVTCLQPPEEEEFGGRLAEYAYPDGLPFWVGAVEELVMVAARSCRLLPFSTSTGLLPFNGKNPVAH